MTRTMKAAVFNGKEIAINTVSEPEIKDSQVLVHIKTVGICGTDMTTESKQGAVKNTYR